MKLKALLLIAFVAVGTSLSHAQAIGWDNTRIFTAAPLCQGAALSATSASASPSLTDVCLVRASAGVWKFTTNDLATIAPQLTPSFSGKTTFGASVAGGASFNIPSSGVVPTTPAAGDFFWVAQGVPSYAEVSGSSIGVAGTIYSLAGAQAATVVNTASTITGSSFTLPAGVMNVAGKTLEGEGWLTNINTTGTPTVAIAVKIGSITLATCTSAAITNAVTAPVHFTFTVKTAVIGASGTDESHCALDIPLAAAGNAVGRYLDNNTAVSSTYDHTAANALVLVGTSAGASNSLTLRDLRYDLKN